MSPLCDGVWRNSFNLLFDIGEKLVNLVIFGDVHRDGLWNG